VQVVVASPAATVRGVGFTHSMSDRASLVQSQDALRKRLEEINAQLFVTKSKQAARLEEKLTIMKSSRDSINTDTVDNKGESQNQPRAKRKKKIAGPRRPVYKHIPDAPRYGSR